MNIDKQELERLEELYLEAKRTYYDLKEEEIMDDDEFDELEVTLRENKSQIVEIVGTTDRTLKFEHLSNMVSLAKAQTTLDGVLPMTQMQKWFSQFSPGTIFEGSPKYDAVACNVIYRKGKFVRALTRGNKVKGKDISSKIKPKVPQDLGIDFDVEVRGEVIMPQEIFERKYKEVVLEDGRIKKYKNSRNFLGGVLNRDDIDPVLISEMHFMAIEARIHDGDFDYPDNTQEWFQKFGFNKEYAKFINFTEDKFEEVYYQMKEYREQESPFQLDGFVIKAQENIRKDFGETGHHPNWAIAVKFPPQKSITKVQGYKWNMGITGRITPIIRLEPVELDGTTIRNTAGFNLGFLQREKVYPGAKVVIAKSGDIIPIIQKVLVPGDEAQFEYPKYCPSCGSPTEVRTIHLWCTNEDCEGKLFKKFLIGIRVTRMMKFGFVTCKTLYANGFKRITDVFDPEKFNKKNLIATGQFSDGRTLDALIAEVAKIKSMPHSRIILALQFDKVGATASAQIAKKIDGQKFSFSGLEKLATDGFEPGEKRFERLQEFKDILTSRGIEVESDIEVLNGIGYEMTGSPKDAGFKTKAEITKFMAQHGYVHMAMNKGAKFLLTNDLNSTKSKMKYARDNGIPIRTYEEITEVGGLKDLTGIDQKTSE